MPVHVRNSPTGTRTHRGMAVIVCALSTLSARPAMGLDEYRFDVVHTQIMFSANHLGLSNPVGRFLKFDGGFRFAPDAIEESSVTLTIYADSLEMGDARWNKALKGKQYFNIEMYPTIQFESTAIEAIGDNQAVVHGDLTLLGVTRPIAVNMRANRVAVHPLTGNQTAGFSGTAKLKRSDFGMTAASTMVGDEVRIMLEVEGILDIVKPKPFQSL